MPLTQSLTKFTTASPVLTSFNFTDVAEGTGIQVFYATRVKDTSGETYHLMQNPVPGIKSATTIQADFTLSVSPQDFDLTEFNSSRTIKGTGYISGYMTIGSGSCSYTAQFKKYDGTTETNIGSSKTISLASGFSQDFLLKFDLSETHFNQGDILRVTMTVGGTATNSNYVGLDPTGSFKSPLKLQVPFKLDI